MDQSFREEKSAAGQRWLGVEFRHLGALAAVAREGSFRRAADSLGYVQSAISGQIAHLERAVGAQLIERASGSAGTTLTPAGELLLAHVEEILARFEAARVDLQTIAEGTENVVRIAVPDGVGPYRLPQILSEFSQRHPAAEVTIDEERTDEASLARLRRGELDLVIAELPLVDGPFEYSLLERDPYVLLVAANSLLAEQRSPVEAEQLKQLRLLVPAPARAADALPAALKELGIEQPPWLRPRGAGGVRALAGAGIGVGIVPALAAGPDDQATITMSLPSTFPVREIVLVRHREREYSAIVRAFMETVERGFAIATSA